jgi:phospholipase/carboxylesterase
MSKPTPASIVIQKPEGAPHQLFLLFHGVGSNAADLVPVGKQFAARFPKALVASAEGLQASDFGQGRQWFSITGITEEIRCVRVAAGMPEFRKRIEQWQQESGVSAAQTTLIGFSQGSIMSLESTQHEPALAAHVIAFSGRFAAVPKLAPRTTAIHLIHGDADSVLPADYSRNAAQQLQTLGATVTLDIEPAMGHGINAHMVAMALDRVSAQE